MKLLAISTLALVLSSVKGGKSSRKLSKKAGKKGREDACFNIYELSDSGTFDGYTFDGVTDEGMFSTPFFYSSDLDGEVAGRVQGFHVGLPDGETRAGNWAFHFFGEDSWIVASLGFGPEETPKVITGASGIFRGTGSVVNIVISEDPDLVIKWTICGAV
jgi:hypothetical protein